MAAAQPNPPPISKRRAWWIAVRPFSLPASVVPVLVGTAVAAEQEFSLPLFLLTLAGSLLIHMGTNLATDFFDFTDGVQPGATLGGVIRGGLLEARDVHRAAIAVFAAGSLCGLRDRGGGGLADPGGGLRQRARRLLLHRLADQVRPPRPRRGDGLPLHGHADGDGVSATCRSRSGRWRLSTPRCRWGMLVANILHANNLRDIVNDRARSKVTIATIIDRPAADVLLWALVRGCLRHGRGLRRARGDAGELPAGGAGAAGGGGPPAGARGAGGGGAEPAGAHGGAAAPAFRAAAGAGVSGRGAAVGAIWASASRARDRRGFTCKAARRTGLRGAIGATRLTLRLIR